MGVLNQWLTEEESLWLQSRIYARAYYFTTVGRNILPPIRWSAVLAG
ncbi:putative cytoplasmic protein [Salmonella enterica subsp. enterica]|uniref:Putative cytoplasmic protein n=1 Tax=Salmonella enterica I TaxID=59201 RepID=A0A379WXF1_SALET|nr:putative cytoplasmic protein [Salmonella enterica subsp. enterica]